MSKGKKIYDIFCDPWALRPNHLVSLAQKFEDIASKEIDAKSLGEAIVEAIEKQDRERLHFRIVDGTAIIAVHGILQQRIDVFESLFFGDTSYEQIKAKINEALSRQDVERIVLDVDSPGGSVFGVAELAQFIFQAKQRKPIISFVNNMAASAGYWLASAASEVVLASETSLTGSIGVVALHRDISGLEEKVGIKTTEIVAGKFKRAASEFSPLSESGKDYLQAQVDRVYAVFIGAVANFRSADGSAEAVISKMAEGREFIGDDGIAAGLADRIDSMESIISGNFFPGPQEERNMDPKANKDKDKEKPKSQEELDEEEKKKKKREEETDEEKIEAMLRAKYATTIAAIEQRAILKERERIIALDKIADEGCHDLVMEAKQSGKRAEDVAFQILSMRQPQKISRESLFVESNNIPHSGELSPQEEEGKQSATLAAQAAKFANERKK